MLDSMKLLKTVKLVELMESVAKQWETIVGVNDVDLNGVNFN